MKALTLCTVVASALLAANEAAYGDANTGAGRPNVQAGDWWQYETTVFPSEEKRRHRIHVEEVTADTIVGGTTRTQSVYDRDWGVRESRRGGEVTYRAEPARPLLRFPMEVGKRWDGSLTAEYPDHTRRWRGHAHVERMETVTVPAGTFRAYVVEFEGYYNTKSGGGTVRWIETIWYAPEAGRWVKRDYSWDTSIPGAQRFTERQVEALVAFKYGDGSVAAR